MQSRTGYIIDHYSTDTRNGNILTLCCIDDDGYFEIEVPNTRILFFVHRDSKVPELRGMSRKPVSLTDFNGRELDGLYFNSRSGFHDGAARLRDSGVRILESDVHPDERFLMEHFIFRGIRVTGEWFDYMHPGGQMHPSAVGISDDRFFSICKARELEPADFSPEFRVLSLDIETGQDGRIFCCGFHISGRGGESKTVLMLDEKAISFKGSAAGEQIIDYKDGSPFTYIPVGDERQLIKGILSFICESNPDIIIGWNVIGFDLSFIENRCRQFGYPFTIGRRGQSGRIYRKRSGLFSVETYGRVVIDGPVSLRGGFHTFEDYRLETVSRALLGEGKDISGHAESDVKVSEIEERFRNDKKALALYNIMDCFLVTGIFNTTALIEQLETRSRLTGLRMDKVNQSVAAFDFFMLPKFHRAGYAAPDVADILPGGHAAGGLVFTSEPGLYENIMVFDFLSLYPSIIRTFMIDPLARLTAERYPDGPIFETPAGIRFSKDTHILPTHIGELMERRAAAKSAGDVPLSLAVKILMNSFYGVMGTTGCRFYHPDLPTAITGTGQWILKTTADYIRDKGFRVIYGDTDSVFVEIPGEAPRLMSRGESLAEEISSWFSRKLYADYGVESRLVLELEKLYSRFFLPPMRGTSEGSRKRYAGLDYETGEIEMKGLEYVRSDWTDLAKEFQMELFRRFFHNEEIPGWIKIQVERIRSGERDDKLIYRRRLTKPAEEYVKNVPPHVKAVRLLDPQGERRIRRVEYVMTLRGPVPIKHPHEDIDYNHYIEKQIEPLADTVLQSFGTSFSEIINGRQGELF